MKNDVISTEIKAKKAKEASKRDGRLVTGCGLVLLSIPLFLIACFALAQVGNNVEKVYFIFGALGVIALFVGLCLITNR